MIRNITKFFYSIFNRPYLSVKLSYQRNDRTLGVDAIYNQLVVMEIDRLYRELGRRDYDPLMPDHDKIAVYVSEMVAGLNPLGTAPAEPGEPGEGDGGDGEITPPPLNDTIPILGTAPVTQTIDLAQVPASARLIR